MSKLKIAVLPGDGIGIDVTHATIPIFTALNIPIELKFADIGWESWKKLGTPIPGKTWELINTSDAVLLGATTSKPEKEALQALPLHLKANPPAYISPIVQLRQNLDLYANVRPCFNITNTDEYYDMTIIRENTEGLYAGFDFYPIDDAIKNIINKHVRWQGYANDEIAATLRLQSTAGLTRLFNFAFEYANKRNIDYVTFADKPNVLRKSSAFVRSIFESIAQNYPNIKSDIHNVDAVALWMIKKPNKFRIIVAENMFGDILSDVGAGVMGGLGFASSANYGDNGCYFEPVHGSAPKINKNTANPCAMFLSISLLLEYFSYHIESQKIKNSIKEIIKTAKYITYDLGGNATTQDMANAIIENAIITK